MDLTFYRKINKNLRIQRSEVNLLLSRHCQQERIIDAAIYQRFIFSMYCSSIEKRSMPKPSRSIIFGRKMDYQWFVLFDML